LLNTNRQEPESSLRVRGAGIRDAELIKSLFDKADYPLDIKHIEMLVVVEDEDGIIAVGSLVTLLEATFLVTENRSKRDKIDALIKLTEQAKVEAKYLDYNLFHVFTKNPQVERTLAKSLGFTPGHGTNLVCFTE
jgi:hypothetical protein